MESKDELKIIDTKDRTCCYFDDLMRAWDRDIDIDFSGILLGEKLYKQKYENILSYDISYKTSRGATPLHIRYDQIDGFIKIHDGIRYLVLFDCGWFDKICDRIKYLISEKSGISESINSNFRRIRIDSYNSLPIEKILTFHNVIILIKPLVNKDKNYYYNIFLKKVCIKINWIHNIFKWIFLYYKYYILIELTFLKELMLLKQVHQECDICHYWYFLNYGFTFQPNTCNRCHDLLMMSMNLRDIAILNIKESNYCCIISLISKIRP